MIVLRSGSITLPQGIVQIEAAPNSILHFDATAPAPDLAVGDVITIAGVTPSGFNGNYRIDSITNSRTFVTNVAHSTTFTDTDNPVFPTYNTVRGLTVTAASEGTIYPADRCTWRQEYREGSGYSIIDGTFYQGAGTIPSIPIIAAELGYIGKSGRFVKIAD